MSFAALLTCTPSQLFFKAFFPQVYSTYIQEHLFTEHLFYKTLDGRSFLYNKKIFCYKNNLNRREKHLLLLENAKRNIRW